MGFIIGKRSSGETYPVAKEQPVAVQPDFAFDQNTNTYTQVEGAPATQIAVATINLQAGSSVKIEGSASFIGSVAAGVGALTSPGSASPVFGAQSFGTTVGSNLQTCSYLAMTDPQPSGPFSIGLFISVSGNAGAQIDYAGPTVLTLTEILA